MTPAAVEIRPLARGDAAPLPALRRRGIATRLVDAAEALAAACAREGEQVVLDDDLLLRLVKRLVPRAARTTP